MRRGTVRLYTCSLRDSAVTQTADHLQNPLSLVPTSPARVPCPILLMQRPIFGLVATAATRPVVRKRPLRSPIGRDPPPQRARECPGLPAHDPSTERGHSPCRQRHGSRRPGVSHRRHGRPPQRRSRSTTARFPSARPAPWSSPPGQRWPEGSFRPSSTFPPPTAPCHPSGPQRQRRTRAAG